MENSIKKNIVLAILVAWVVTLLAQGSFTVRHFNMIDGLSHNMSKNIVQDKHGYIWICTWNGIDKFDGYEFKNYKSYPNDSVKLNNNRVEGIYLNSQNNLWVKTYGQQLFLLNQHTDKFEEVFPKNMSPHIADVICLNNGISWALDDNNVLYRLNEKKLHDPDGIQVFSGDKYPFLGGSIRNIFLDSKGNEWILSDKGVITLGNLRLENKNIPFRHIIEINNKIILATQKGYIGKFTSGGKTTPIILPIKLNQINRLLKINKENIAIISTKHIIIYNLITDKSQVINSPEGTEFIASDKDYADSKGVLWAFVSGSKIMRYDIERNIKNIINYPNLTGLNLTHSIVSFIHEDPYGEIWIMLGEGILCEYNKFSNSLDLAFWTDQFGKGRNLAVSSREYLIDNQKNIWISTRDGVEYLSFLNKKIELGPDTEGSEARAILIDRANNTWLGLKNGKIEIYDSKYNYVGNLGTDGRIHANKDYTFGMNIYSFLQDKQGTIWMGSRGEGLFRLQPQNNNIFNIQNYRPSNDPYSISSESVYSILQDTEGRIWIGSFGGGLNLIEEQSNGSLKFIHAGNKLKNYPVEQCPKIRHLYQTRKGTLLIASNNGLISYSPVYKSPEDISFFYNFCKSDRSDCLSNNDILDIFQDSKGVIYISSFSGGVDITSDDERLLSSDIKFSNLNKKNGLGSDLSLSVIEDEKSNLWIASANSFSRLDLNTNKIDLFNAENLLYNFQLSEATPVRNNKGELIFGTSTGVLRLRTNQLKLKQYVPPIVFTAVSTQSKNSNGEKIIISNDSITLQKQERNININFSALDFSNSEALKYSYRLKDKSDEWISLGKNHSASLINLEAGEHVFEVKSTNSDGVWTDNITPLYIYVIPTFWETGYAIAIYILGFILLVLITSYIILKMLNLRREVEMEHELSGLKLKFFTDISHELRTPLTLITNPIEEIMNNETLSEEGRENISIAKSNADHMLKLINQILDFRKAQSNKLKVYLTQKDINIFIKRIFHDFHGIANQNMIDFQIENNISEHTLIYFDDDKLEKIIFNLLSNAFKHTPPGKSICMNVQLIDNSLQIQISDQGNGFDISKIELLFSRFGTSKESGSGLSTGIGLSLVKELVNILHGSIDVQSTKGVGSTFTVALPVTLEQFAEDSNVELVLDDSESENTEYYYQDDFDDSGDKENTLLIVEDNAELRAFIKKILSKEFKVIEAANGKEGLEIISHMQPDLVISDIMMPEMDGIEFLKTIRSSTESSHIPVILLTAKSSLDDQISGMEYGADEYITKPFSSTFLKVKLNTLLRRRKMLSDYYINQSNEDKWAPSRPQISNFDDEFIRKIIGIIEENIDDNDFKIESIAESLNMSRPVFYRKIKSIIGLSPIEFVKKIKLKRAIQLMETNQFSISEIAYQSGFNTPQYLSRVFKDNYGCSPSEYMQKLKEEKED